jgi:hypothetical protein
MSLAGSAQYSANHMAVEALKRIGERQINYVPFKGTGDSDPPPSLACTLMAPWATYP